jgi:hypothetical protein
MSNHGTIGWMSLIVSVANYLFLLYLVFVGLPLDSDNWMKIIISSTIVLTLIGFVSGIIARFGKQKDNFGIPGIVSIVMTPILLIYAIGATH